MTLRFAFRTARLTFRRGFDRATGVSSSCGGLTTFSALGVEGFQLLRANRIDLFAWTMLAHVGIGVLAVSVGWKLGQMTFVH